jgi:hypothetical protein
VAYRKHLEQAAKLLAQDRRSPLSNAVGCRYDRLLSEMHFGAANVKAKMIGRKHGKEKTLIA